MSYHQKIETKLNDLQKGFFRLFRKIFPDLQNNIEIEKGVIHSDNFCFSVNSSSDIFGKLQFDIDDREVTVFSNFDHRHFPMYHYGSEKNRQRQIYLTCNSVFEYIKDFIDGNIIIEYEQQGDKIIKSFTYHKDNPLSLFSATINLEEIPKKKSVKIKFKEIFQLSKKQPIVRKKVNWFGEIK